MESQEPPEFGHIQAIPIPCMIVSDTDLLLAANKPMKKLFPNAQWGRNLWFSLRHANLGDLLEKARAGAQPAQAELRLTTPTLTIFQATAARYDSKHILICLQDMNETSNAVQMRKDFIADLSHELRSPLTAIQGILETASNDPDALAYFLPTLSTQVERMNLLVQDLLALSRIENNARRVPQGQVNLHHFLQQVHASIQPAARAQDIEIDIQIPPEDIVFTGDENELMRALVNLIENAMRYGGDGKRVEISARIETASRKNRKKTLRIDITDFGKGVALHHLPRLTERFYRADTHRSRNEGGHGLGLAIVKHIAAHHRGRLLLSIPENAGFQASLILPL